MNRVTRNNIAALDAAGRPTSFNPNADLGVWSLTVAGNAVYVGGAFTNVGGESRDRIAKLSISSGNAFSGFDPGALNPVNGTVLALAVDGSGVYAGGEFTTIGGQARNRIAKLSTADGHPFSFDPNAGGLVNAIAIDDGGVYAGGTFSSIGGLPRENIAKLSPLTGNAFSGFNPNANGPVAAVAADGGKAYIGGLFSQVGGRPRQGYAQFTQP